MVSFNGKCLPCIQVSLHEVKEILLVAYLVGLAVVPNVVWRHVAGPKKSVWGQLIDFVGHLLENTCGHIAFTDRPKLASLILWVLRKTMFGPTAEYINTLYC